MHNVICKLTFIQVVFIRFGCIIFVLFVVLLEDSQLITISIVNGQSNTL